MRDQVVVVVVAVVVEVVAVLVVVVVAVVVAAVVVAARCVINSRKELCASASGCSLAASVRVSVCMFVCVCELAALLCFTFYRRLNRAAWAWHKINCFVPNEA